MNYYTFGNGSYKNRSLNTQYENQVTPHYIIPIKYTPFFNKYLAADLSNSISTFFEKISIIDLDDYEKKYGVVQSIKFYFPSSKKSKSKRTELQYFLRNPESLKVIEKYMNYFQLGSDVNCLIFENFKPKLLSKMIFDKINNSTIIVDHKEFSLLDEIKFKDFDGSWSMSYNPSHLLLEITEEELAKIVNLKILRNIN